jgi:hypothetical protein
MNSHAEVMAFAAPVARLVTDEYVHAATFDTALIGPEVSFSRAW